jgi:hypothetical protein
MLPDISPARVTPRSKCDCPGVAWQAAVMLVILEQILAVHVTADHDGTEVACRALLFPDAVEALQGHRLTQTTAHGVIGSTMRDV